MVLQIFKSIHRHLNQSDWLKTYETPGLKSLNIPLKHLYEYHLKAALGFPIQDFTNAEVITIPLSGSLSHQDNYDHLGILQVGDIQLISAGTGISQSELNGSDKNEAIFLQIWIQPEKRDVLPRYQIKSYDLLGNLNHFHLLVSKSGREDSLQINQDCDFYLAKLSANHQVSHSFKQNRSGWLQIIEGLIVVNGLEAEAGDGCFVQNESLVDLVALQPAKVLLLDAAS